MGGRKGGAGSPVDRCKRHSVAWLLSEDTHRYSYGGIDLTYSMATYGAAFPKSTRLKTKRIKTVCVCVRVSLSLRMICAFSNGIEM